jgi:hypothetical protein
MRPNPAGLTRQKGVALILLLVALILASGYAILRSTNLFSGRSQQEAKTAAALAQAKEALIARAVTDANRPGSLPCPDLVTNSAGLANFPGDGKADMFTLTQCPSYVGWLPWVTLDLPDLTDESGTRLWYVLSPELRDDDSAQPINSDRSFTLRLDGVGDIAALVIAARTPLAGQTRPSNNPADYLDGANATDDGIYVSGPPSSTFNDLVVAITRQELMAAVEKRVAGEVRACVEQHAASTANPTHSYPWPAPLASTAFRGVSGALFGQVPATQPGAGPESMLQQSTAALADARSALAGATTAAEQMTALTLVSNAATLAMALYDRLYAVAGNLATVAEGSRSAFAALDTDITGATANGRISRTERTNLRAEAITVKDSLSALQAALTDSGIDAFPGEVQTLDTALQQAINAATSTASAATFSALQSRAAALAALYARARTPNPDIALALAGAANAAATAATSAANAAAVPADGVRVAAALSAASALVSGDANLRTTISTRRLNLEPGDIGTRGDSVSRLLATFSASPGATTSATLATGLADLESTALALTTASTPVVSARSALLAALADALAAARAGTDSSLIQTTSTAAVASAGTLKTAMDNNGDNVAKESLSVAANSFNSAQAIFNTVTPPTQRDMVPYVQAVQAPAVDIAYWSEIIVRDATDIAARARRTPTATTDDAASAFTAAGQLTSGIGGSQAALQSYIDAPSNAAKQAAATAALGTTQSQMDTVIAAATGLDSVLDSGTAAALPTLWAGVACAFLQPGTGNTSWWSANAWADTAFYQISSRVRSLPITSPCTGTLKVNGSGSYCIVALNAGRALSGQNRGTRTVANFLEGANADPSRDGNATNPVATLSSQPVSPAFNDRLAY